MSDHNGTTLIEIIVVLGVMGILIVSFIGLGSSVSGGIEKRNFEAESKMVLSKMIQLQNETMMSGDGMSNSIQFYENMIKFVIYDSEARIYRTEIMPIKHSKIKGTFAYGEVLRFSTLGTVSKGGTVDFYRNNKIEKQIVVQIGTGRIYLKK